MVVQVFLASMFVGSSHVRVVSISVGKCIKPQGILILHIMKYCTAT